MDWEQVLATLLATETEEGSVPVDLLVDMKREMMRSEER